MSDKNDWLKQKEQLLGELTRYIAGCSNLDPLPLAYVAGLQTVKVQIELATEIELRRYLAWWGFIRPKPSNNLRAESVMGQLEK